MIPLLELLTLPPDDTDFDVLVAEAHRAARRGALEEALRTGCAALRHASASEDGYTRVARLLTELFARAGAPRAALSMAWFTRDAAGQAELSEAVPPVDRARTLAGAASEDDDERGFEGAARAFEEAGAPVHAAIAFERAGQAEAARALWSRLAERLDARTDDYAAGLARFNVARTSEQLGDARGARDATVAAVHRLEEAADRFESVGQRERAFDCYGVLVAIGELSGTFEHVLEGMVNAIRVLTGDNLRQHALGQYERAIELAERAGEPAAAATLARELTAYAEQQGLRALATRGTRQQSELWQKVADSTLVRGGPSELAENALLASLIAAADASDYARVGGLFTRLSELDVEASRKRHYARASQRYRGVANAPASGATMSANFTTVSLPPSVWHDDLVEWENAGSALEGTAELCFGFAREGSKDTPRRVLLARLAALGAEAAPASAATRAGVLVATALGDVGLYGLLSALEHLCERPEAEVRCAAVRSLSRCFFKRSFVMIARALADPNDRVAGEATSALERLRFEHAWDPLARIYRTATRPAAQLAALRALARLDAPEAAELVLGALAHGGSNERDEALAVLKTARGVRFIEAARAAFPTAAPPLKEALREVFTARGVPLPG